MTGPPTGATTAMPWESCSAAAGPAARNARPGRWHRGRASVLRHGSPSTAGTSRPTRCPTLNRRRLGSPGPGHQAEAAAAGRAAAGNPAERRVHRADRAGSPDERVWRPGHRSRHALVSRLLGSAGSRSPTVVKMPGAAYATRLGAIRRWSRPTNGSATHEDLAGGGMSSVPPGGTTPPNPPRGAC